MIRKTKIVCTLGPASDSEEMISKLMDAGMNVCRLNMSHGSYEEQGARIERIKRLRREKNIPVAIMLDTKGPEVRTKTLKGDKVTLQAGQEFILTSRDIEGDETQVAITYPRMVELVHPGNRILIDDGLIALDVKQIKGGTDIVCSVVNGGVLGGITTGMPVVFRARRPQGHFRAGRRFADALHRRKGSQRHRLRH